MIAMVIGVSSYILAGFFSLIFPRHGYRISFTGLLGAFAGTIVALVKFLNSGPYVDVLGRWGALGIEIRLDQTTLLFIALAGVLNLFTFLYIREPRKSTFFCLYNFLFAAAFSIAFSNDLFNIYVTIELMSLISILLIGYERKTYQIYAGIKYLLLSSLAMSIYLLGLGIVYRNLGYLGIEGLSEAAGSEVSFSTYVGLGLLIAGLLVKGGVFLFSMWLPDAYTYSETVVAVILSGIATKFGLVGIIRIARITDFSSLLMVLGAITGIVGAVLAIMERIPKRILSFTSISQMGYVLIGAGLGTPLGILGASLHIFFHGLFKGLLFLSVGHAEAGETDLYRDHQITVPASSQVGIAVGSLSIMGVPPFNGYFSKYLVVQPGVPLWVSFASLLISVVTAMHAVKLSSGFLFRRTGGKTGKSGVALIGFAVVVVVSGVVAGFFAGMEAWNEVFQLKDVISSFAAALVGGVLYAGTRKWLKGASVPSFPFELDGSLITIFTGFTLIVVILLVL